MIVNQSIIRACIIFFKYYLKGKIPLFHQLHIKWTTKDSLSMNPYIFQWGLSWGVTQSSVSTRSSLSSSRLGHLSSLPLWSPMLWPKWTCLWQHRCNDMLQIHTQNTRKRSVMVKYPSRALFRTPTFNPLQPAASGFLTITACNTCVHSHCSCLFSIDFGTSPIPQQSRSEREDRQQVTSFVCFNFIHILSHLLAFTVADMAAASPPINPSSSAYLG